MANSPQDQYIGVIDHIIKDLLQQPQVNSVGISMMIQEGMEREKPHKQSPLYQALLQFFSSLKEYDNQQGALMRLREIKQAYS